MALHVTITVLDGLTDHEVGNDRVENNRSYPLGYQVSQYLREEEDGHAIEAAGILVTGRGEDEMDSCIPLLKW